MILRIVSVLAAIMFLGFAAVQYNDPDPYIWIPVYLYPAVLAVFTFRKKPPLWPALAGIVGFLVFFADWEPGNLDKHWIEVEEWREAMGLAICAGWCAVVAVAARKQQRR